MRLGKRAFESMMQMKRIDMRHRPLPLQAFSGRACQRRLTPSVGGRDITCPSGGGYRQSWLGDNEPVRTSKVPEERLLVLCIFH
jgi:hypothetical protein